MGGVSSGYYHTANSNSNSNRINAMTYTLRSLKSMIEAFVDIIT